MPHIISALQRAYHQRFSLSAKASPSKPVKTGYAILDASLPGRKTAGLVTLQASRVNAATLLGNINAVLRGQLRLNPFRNRLFQLIKTLVKEMTGAGDYL